MVQQTNFIELHLTPSTSANFVTFKVVTPERQIPLLTHNVEVDGIALKYSGWNLAFINACVPFLHILDDQCPFIGCGIVSGQESLICRVSILAHC